MRTKQRSVKSSQPSVPVDAHERTRDYLTEEEFRVLLQGTRHSRARWRNAAMLMLTFYQTGPTHPLRWWGITPAHPTPYLHPTVTIESDPWIAWPLNVWPVSEAEVFPH